MIDVNTTTTIAPATAWGFTIESLAKDTEHLPIEAQRLLQDCVQWAMQHGISRAEFAESLGTTDNTLYKICTGRQLDPSKGTKLQLSSRIYGNLQRWIASRKKVRGAAMLPAFVETQTAAKVFYACDLARESRTTVWLYGPTHCGKSTALREYAAQHGRSVRYVEFLAATGPIDMLREICGACCIPSDGSKVELLHNLARTLTPDTVLILDETHALIQHGGRARTYQSLELIRGLYEKTGCGIVFCVTDVMWDRLNRHRADDLRQLMARSPHRIAVGTANGSPEKEDVVRILEAAGMDFPSRNLTVDIEGITFAPLQVISDLVKGYGLLLLTERLRMASKLASRDGRPLDWQDFGRAHLIMSSNGAQATDWT